MLNYKNKVECKLLHSQNKRGSSELPLASAVVDCCRGYFRIFYVLLGHFSCQKNNFQEE